MSLWGISEWGASEWGDLTAIFPPPASSDGPHIINRIPTANQLDVAENAVMSVSFFDPNFDLDTKSILININGRLVYSGALGFAPNYVGTTRTAAGTYTVQFTYTRGFLFGQTIKFYAYAADLAGNFTESYWDWRVRLNNAVYNGFQPLPIEVAIQQPFTTFLDLELFRQLFLSNALQPQNAVISNAGNKAARVMYQLAYATELSVILNPYNLKNAEALATRVAERQRALTITTALYKFRQHLDRAMSALQQLGALPESYTRGFVDYADSSLFIYRVSLVANMLLFAKAYELQQG
jgi:hypothetical protein